MDIYGNQKSQYLYLFEGALVLGFIAVSWMTFLSPVIEKDKTYVCGISRAGARIASAEQMKNIFPELPIRKNISSARMLSELYRLAGNAGVELKTVKPDRAARAAGNGWSWTFVPMAITLRGSQNDVLGFADSLARQEFLCRVAAMTLEADRSQAGWVDGSLTLHKIERITLPAARDRAPKVIRAVDLKSFANVFKCPDAQAKIIPGPAADDGDPVKDLRLVGIFDDGAPKAIIEDKKAQKSYVLRLGDEIAGLKIAAIANREVLMGSEKKNYSLVL